MKRVIVHIDSLALKGFRHEDRYAIADGLRQELARLLGEPAAAEGLARTGNTARLQAGKVQVQQTGKQGRVGAEVARGIVRRVRS